MCRLHHCSLELGKLYMNRIYETLLMRFCSNVKRDVLASLYEFLFIIDMSKHVSYKIIIAQNIPDKLIILKTKNKLKTTNKQTSLAIWFFQNVRKVIHGLNANSKIKQI